MSIAELVTSIMGKVERIQTLKQELAGLIAEVRLGQTELAESGVVMAFPVLDEASIAANPVVGTSVVGPSGHDRMIAGPVVPPGPPPKTDEELREEEEGAGIDVDQEVDLSKPLAEADRRTAPAIRAEALVQPTAPEEAAFRQDIATKFDEVIAAGFAAAVPPATPGFNISSAGR